MTDRFPYAVDAEAETFIASIIGEMCTRFGIAQEKAEARVAGVWGRLKIGGPEEIAYHEDEAFWACNFYYGKDSFWWIQGEEREAQGLPPLRPAPFPRDADGAA
jgi:hypothetical protein